MWKGGGWVVLGNTQSDGMSNFLWPYCSNRLNVLTFVRIGTKFVQNPCEFSRNLPFLHMNPTMAVGGLEVCSPVVMDQGSIPTVDFLQVLLVEALRWCEKGDHCKVGCCRAQRSPSNKHRR